MTTPGSRVLVSEARWPPNLTMNSGEQTCMHGLAGAVRRDGPSGEFPQNLFHGHNCRATTAEEVGFLSRYKEAMLFVVAQRPLQKDI